MASNKSEELMQLLASHYADRTDDYTVSIGHWVVDPECPSGMVVMKKFVADIRLTVGEIRKMADPSYPYEGPTMEV